MPIQFQFDCPRFAIEIVLTSRTVVVVFKIRPVSQVRSYQANSAAFVKVILNKAIYKSVASLANIVKATCATLRGYSATQGQLSLRQAVACTEAEHMYRREVTEVIRIGSRVFLQPLRVDFCSIFILTFVICVANKNTPVFRQFASQFKFCATTLNLTHRFSDGLE